MWRLRRFAQRLFTFLTTFAWLDDARRDVSYAIRTLARTPSFSVVAILTIAVGIGATTAIFSVVNSVLLQPLPYPDSDRLVHIVEYVIDRDGDGVHGRMNRAEMDEWRARTRTLSTIAGALTPPLTMMSRREGAVRLSGALVSPELFEVLGATARIGRTLEASDGDASAAGTVVLSAQAWQRYFQSDPSIVGKTVSLRSVGSQKGPFDGQPLVIVGVMPPSFAFPSPQTDFWAPVTKGASPQTSFNSTVARLRDDVSIEAARQEANTIGSALRPPRAAAKGGRVPSPRFDVISAKEQLVGRARPALRVFTVAAGVVLLIVCANVANLLLARGTARTREMAVRLAIGAGRGRLVRQVLTESLVLSIAGGLLAAALAAVGVWVLKTIAGQEPPGIYKAVFGYGGWTLPRVHEIGVDRTMLFAAMGLSAIVAVIFGIAPAMHVARVSQLQAMGARGEGGSSAGNRTESRLRNVLVVSQLAMATTLLIGAGLLIHSFVKLSRVETGYDPAPVLTFHLVLPEEYPTPRKTAVIEDLIEQLRRLPGVQHAGFSFAAPLLGASLTVGVFVPPGRTVEEMRGQSGQPHIRSISHDYLQTLGVGLLEGRWFNERDTATAPPVIIINRRVARQFFGSRSPVGALVHLDRHMKLPPYQIVGVVDDIRQARLDKEAWPEMFMDYRQVLPFAAALGFKPEGQEHLALGFLSFAARTEGDPERLANDVRALVGRVDPAAGLDLIIPMQRLVSISITNQRFYAALLGTFAGIAALLGAIGIYGVLSFGVIQRTQEIGVRMALGAQRAHVLRLVLGRGLLLTIAGMAIGIAGAIALTRYLTGLLYGLTALDASTYIAVSCLFAAVALVASYLPARRATRVDPLIALRWE